MAAGASRGLNRESDTDAWKSDIGNHLVLLIVKQGTDFQGRGPRRCRATRTRLEMKNGQAHAGLYQCGDRDLGTGIATRSRCAARPARETPSGPSTAESGHWPRKWGGSGSGVGRSSEEKQIIHGDVQVREESGAGHLDATGITSFRSIKKQGRTRRPAQLTLKCRFRWCFRSGRGLPSVNQNCRFKYHDLAALTKETEMSPIVLTGHYLSRKEDKNTLLTGLHSD